MPQDSYPVVYVRWRDDGRPFDIGEVILGTDPATLELEVYNGSSTPYTLGSPNQTPVIRPDIGASTSPFTRTWDSGALAGVVIPAGGTVPIDVTYAPNPSYSWSASSALVSSPATSSVGPFITNPPRPTLSVSGVGLFCLGTDVWTLCLNKTGFLANPPSVSGITMAVGDTHNGTLTVTNDGLTPRTIQVWLLKPGGTLIDPCYNFTWNSDAFTAVQAGTNGMRAAVTLAPGMSHSVGYTITANEPVTDAILPLATKTSSGTSTLSGVTHRLLTITGSGTDLAEFKWSLDLGVTDVGPTIGYSRWGVFDPYPLEYQTRIPRVVASFFSGRANGGVEFFSGIYGDTAPWPVRNQFSSSPLSDWKRNVLTALGGPVGATIPQATPSPQMGAGTTLHIVADHVDSPGALPPLYRYTGPGESNDRTTMLTLVPRAPGSSSQASYGPRRMWNRAQYLTREMEILRPWIVVPSHWFFQPNYHIPVFGSFDIVNEGKEGAYLATGYDGPGGSRKLPQTPRSGIGYPSVGYGTGPTWPNDNYYIGPETTRSFPYRYKEDAPTPYLLPAQSVGYGLGYLYPANGDDWVGGPIIGILGYSGNPFAFSANDGPAPVVGGHRMVMTPGMARR